MPNIPLERNKTLLRVIFLFIMKSKIKADWYWDCWSKEDSKVYILSTHKIKRKQKAQDIDGVEQACTIYNSIMTSRVQGLSDWVEENGS